MLSLICSLSFVSTGLASRLSAALSAGVVFSCGQALAREGCIGVGRVLYFFLWAVRVQALLFRRFLPPFFVVRARLRSLSTWLFLAGLSSPGLLIAIALFSERVPNRGPFLSFSFRFRKRPPAPSHSEGYLSSSLLLRLLPDVLFATLAQP